MHVSLSIIKKADTGSIGGHICPPSQCLVQTVREFITEHGAKLLLDSYVSYTGDDIAIVSTHERRPTNEAVHKLCWDVFIAGTEAAKVQGLYGAGQDLITRIRSPAMCAAWFQRLPNSARLCWA